MFKYPITVTIDTNVMDAAKYDLSKGSTLQILSDYVKDGTIKVVLSNIVVREAKNHLAKQVSKICSIARNSRAEILKASTEHLVKHIGLNKLLELEKDKKLLVSKSEELFDNFMNELNVEILDNDLIDLNLIIDDYFKINPPFEEGEKKRKEFPDAFIAEQIRKKFGETEIVAIISEDKGFKKACQYTSNHLFFDSLGQLYTAINREKASYADTLSIIEELQYRISSAVFEHIKTNENIEVRGLSCDKDGIVSGFDYNDIYLQSVSIPSFHIHSVDKLSDTSSTVTISCNAEFIVDCSFEDYNNAPWDSETKEYVFVDTIQMREEHKARFGCRIEIERTKKTFKIFPFTIILGGDSRKKRYEIKDQPEFDLEQELQDMDRESIGLRALGSYESYLEENLPESPMSDEIIAKFEELNTMYKEFEDFSIAYDSLLERIKDTDNANIINALSKSLSNISDYPQIKNDDSVTGDELEKIKEWIAKKEDIASDIAEQKLPDSLNFDEKIDVNGVDDSKVILSIDKIAISPTAGSEEIIAISLSNEREKIATGYVKLTIGYLDFDEDGGASDGLEDEIEYNYSEILEQLESFIAQQKREFEKEFKIVESIRNILKL